MASKFLDPGRYLGGDKRLSARVRNEHGNVCRGRRRCQVQWLETLHIVRGAVVLVNCVADAPEESGFAIAGPGSIVCQGVDVSGVCVGTASGVRIGVDGRCGRPVS